MRARYCSTCYGRGFHMSGCPDDEEPTHTPERDPDEILEDRRDREMERARNVDAWDHLDEVARAKGYDK